MILSRVDLIMKEFGEVNKVNCQKTTKMLAEQKRHSNKQAKDQILPNTDVSTIEFERIKRDQT